MSAYDDQEAMFERVINDAKLYAFNSGQVEHLTNFLDNISTKVRRPAFQFVNSSPGVSWEWDHGHVLVLFGLNNEWEWQTRSVATELGKHRVFNRSASFKGGPRSQ
jgi:hypothetical protein